MRKFIMIAAVTAMAGAMPALADAKGGKGKGQGARTEVRSGGHARTDSRAHVRARTRTGVAIDRRRDTDRDGIPDYRDRDFTPGTGWVYEDGRWVRTGHHGRTTHPHGCPPGLANRNPPCVPPGQARRMFREGQRVPASYRDYVGYNTLVGRLPVDWRDDIPVGDDYRYIYRDNQVYVVDARTRLIRRIISILN